MIIDREKQLETILVIVTGMLIFYWFSQNIILLYIAIGLALLGLISTTVAKWVTWFWYKLAMGLGYVNSKVLLSILFFTFLVPLAFMSRVFGGKNDALGLKKNGKGSYFVKQEKVFEKGDLENMW